MYYFLAAIAGGLVIGSIVHAIMTRRMRKLSEHIAGLCGQAGVYNLGACNAAMMRDWHNAQSHAVQYLELQLAIEMSLWKQRTNVSPVYSFRACPLGARAWVDAVAKNPELITSLATHYIPKPEAA